MRPICRRGAAILSLTAFILIPAPAPVDEPKVGVAPDLTGSWTWTWKDAQGQTHKHVMNVEGEGAKSAAREVFDDQEPVKVGAFAFEDNLIKFRITRGKRQADYRGKLKDHDHLNGTVLITSEGQTEEFPWSAVRGKKPAG